MHPHDFSSAFIELGAALIGLALLARLASRWGFSSIPLYLIAGLCFGHGGLHPLDLSKGFIEISASIGVLMLLFMLGLEYTGEELDSNLKKGFRAGVLDWILNFSPGVIAGLLMGWKPMPAVLLGGCTWVSSSGLIAKVLTELKRLDNPETKTVLSILVLEDLAMAVYLPLVAAILIGGSLETIGISVCVALATVLIVLIFAIKCGEPMSKFVAHESDEIILLTAFGAVLLVSAVAQMLQVSAAIGAFLTGLALSGPIAKQSHRIFAPLRDLFAAMFFFFFGLEIDPGTLGPVLPAAVALGIVTALTKILTGYIATKGADLTKKERVRAGVALVARGEFSIVIAGLGVLIEPTLGPFAAAYVLFLAILGPLLARFV